MRGVSVYLRQKENLRMKVIKTLLLISAATILMGCGSTKVVFVDTQAQIVRIGPNVKGKVYVLKNGDWVLSKNNLHLPEGWYAGALPVDAED